MTSLGSFSRGLGVSARFLDVNVYALPKIQIFRGGYWVSTGSLNVFEGVYDRRVGVYVYASPKIEIYLTGDLIPTNLCVSLR